MKLPWKKEVNFGVWRGINLVVPSKRGGGSEVDVNGGGWTACTPLCQLQRESVREDESVGIKKKQRLSRKWRFFSYRDAINVVLHWIFLRFGWTKSEWCLSSDEFRGPFYRPLTACPIVSHDITYHLRKSSENLFPKLMKI